MQGKEEYTFGECTARRFKEVAADFVYDNGVVEVSLLHV